MNIMITAGIGTGGNELSAFDDALLDAGILNYNLIYLSSVIPPNSSLQEVDKYTPLKDDFGKRLYIVRAAEISSNPGEHIACGVGWYQLSDGRGFFVEHHLKGDFTVIGKINNLIQESIMEMCGRRLIPYDSINLKMKVVSSICEDRPVAVIVAAVYKAESW